MTKHGPLPERRLLESGLFGCKPVYKDKTQNACCGVRRPAQSTALMNSLFSIMGDADLVSESCSSQSPIDFLNFYFQRRPEETAGRLDSNVHTDSGFTLSPVGS